MHAFLKYRTIITISSIILLLAIPSFAQAQSGTAELGVFDPQQAAPGAVVQVPISIRNVQELYALDITLQFDPKIVQVEDVDPSTPGVQASLGTFLDPGLMLFNVADNEKGTYHFAMSQYNPSVGKSGEGIIVVLKFKGMTAGESALSFTNVQLSTREGIEITSKGINGKISVSAGAPTQAATYEIVESTALIDVNKITPQPTVTETPVATATMLATQKVTGGETAFEATAAGTEEVKENSYFLVENWWIVLLLLLVVIGAGVYFLVIKKK